MEKAPCKDCQQRFEACHDTCQKYKAWKAAHDAEAAYTKEMNDCGRCVPYNHNRDMHQRRSSSNRPKAHWGD